MRKILNRGAKRRLRRKQQSARRLRNRSIRGLEPLEERRLLAVSPDGNFAQMFNPVPVPSPVTSTVERIFSVPFGADAGIAVVANYTNPTAVTLSVDLDNDGTIDFTLDKTNATPVGNPLDLDKPLDKFVQGHHKDILVTLAPGIFETLNSTVWIIPIGSNVMGRDVRVTLNGGVTTDFIATVGSYHGVNQVDPVGTVGDDSLAPAGGAVGFSLLGFGPVDETSATLDGLIVLARQNPAVPGTVLPLNDLVPDPLAADFSPVDQTEVLDAAHQPAANRLFRGGASVDDADDMDGDALPNTVDMDWRFDPSGGAAYAHVGVEILMDTAPDIDFVFDFGDAPDSYGTLDKSGGPKHAPKGAMLGPGRDKEMDGFPSAGANGDDLNDGVDAMVDADGDDEDGVTNFATNGVVVNGGTFISQCMGINTGSMDIEVTLDKDKLGAEIPAYITAWVDWDLNGKFDKSDMVIAGTKVTTSGTKTYSFNIPDQTVVTKEGLSYVRVRLSHATMGDPTVLPPGGHASSGEVEDYAVELEHGAEIHGIKFEDLDGDGVRDLGEPPMPGVLISLQSKTGGGKSSNVIDCDAKDFVGDPGVTFSFNEDGYLIAATKGHVAIDPLTGNPASGINTTTGGQVANPLVFTRVDGGDFFFDKYDIRTASGAGNQSEEVVFTGLLNGKVVYSFTDDDASLVFDAGVANKFATIPIDELQIIDKHNGAEAGALVDNLVFSHVKDELGKAVQSVITDKDGKFWFVNLEEGSYTVVEHPDKSDTNGDGVFDAGDTVGGHFVDQGLTPSTPTSIAVTLKDGQCLDGLLFGNYITGSIHGVKFHDLDGDGVWDKADEPPLQGVKFDLFKFVKTTVTIKASLGGTVITKYNWKDVGDATTDIHGEFWFTDLDPGVYEVVEQQSASVKQSTPQPIKDPNTLNTNPATSNTAYQIISRREFVWAAGAASRIMDLDGSKTITQDEIDVAKAKGALKVEVLATPAVDAAPADKAQDLWFGNFLLGTILGFKYEDVNRNGKFDGPDVPLKGAKFELKDTTGKVVATATTDAAGMFVFSAVAAGDYTINEAASTDTNGDGTPDSDQEMVLDPTVQNVTIVSGKTVDLTDTAAERDLWGNYIFGSIHGSSSTTKTVTASRMPMRLACRV
jgi:hypothetical protein